MTPEQRLDKIESMLAEMQIRIDTLSANLEDVTSQLDNALKRIAFWEEKKSNENKDIALKTFKGRLN